MSTPYSKAKEALWNHMDQEHDLPLLDSEINEIVRLACAVRDAEMGKTNESTPKPSQD